MVIGLTGSSGSGKSTVASLFAENGYFIVDCDKISREIDTDPLYVSEIISEFGNDVIDAKEKRVDRKKLGELIFNSENSEKLRLRLNGISHPIILGITEEKIERAKEKGLDVIVDAPLLFESGFNKKCDLAIGVIADEKLRTERVRIRDNISEKYAENRVKSQKENKFYISSCDYIIYNNGDMKELQKSFAHVLKVLRERSPGEKE